MVLLPQPTFSRSGFLFGELVLSTFLRRLFVRILTVPPGHSDIDHLQADVECSWAIWCRARGDPDGAYVAAEAIGLLAAQFHMFQIDQLGERFPGVVSVGLLEFGCVDRVELNGDLFKLVRATAASGEGVAIGHADDQAEE